MNRITVEFEEWKDFRDIMNRLYEHKNIDWTTTSTAEDIKQLKKIFDLDCDRIDFLGRSFYFASEEDKLLFQMAFA